MVQIVENDGWKSMTDYLHHKIFHWPWAYDIDGCKAVAIPPSKTTEPVWVANVCFAQMPAMLLQPHWRNSGPDL